LLQAVNIHFVKVVGQNIVCIFQKKTEVCDGYEVGRSCPLCRQTVANSNIRHYDIGENRKKMHVH
jgi:hypothetical protein